MTELRRRPPMMEHARAAAAEALSSQSLTPRLKAALLAYGFWQLDDAGGAGSPGPALARGDGTGSGRSGVVGV
jgi:hypothetical protein